MNITTGNTKRETKQTTKQQDNQRTPSEHDPSTLRRGLTIDRLVTRSFLRGGRFVVPPGVVGVCGTAPDPSPSSPPPLTVTSPLVDGSSSACSIETRRSP